VRSDILPESSIAQVIQKRPSSFGVFWSFHMNCVGCWMAKYCTLTEAARAYHVPFFELVNQLSEVDTNPPHQETT